MAGIRTTPYPSKYQIAFEPAGKDKYWSQKTTFDMLLRAHGQHVKNYTDISHVADGLSFSKLGITESKVLTPLLDYVTGSGDTEVINTNWVRWRVYGEPERRAMSFGNPNAETYIGQGGLPFKIRLDVNWFKAHDLLASWRQKRCQIVIMSDYGVPVDGAYEYEAVLWNDNKAEYVPAEYFSVGQYWLKMGSVSSWEKFGSAGSIQFGEGFSYIEWEVPMTTMAWEFEIEGEAHRRFGNVEITAMDGDRPIPNGSKITNYHEIRANRQINAEKEMMLTWGTKVDTLVDKNSLKQLTSGPGVKTFLEEGNVVKYSVEAQGVDFIAEHLNGFWFDRVQTNNREVLFLTGQAGSIMFSNWVREKFNATSATYMYDFVLQKRTPFDPKGGRGGYSFANPHFTEYHLDGYGVIKVAQWPILDNTRISGVNYPGTQYPITSYEFIAFNIGLGESNVKFLRRDDNRISTYIPGLWSPVGAVGQDNPIWKIPSYHEESYKWLHRETFGVVLLDPSLSLIFKPNISY